MSSEGSLLKSSRNCPTAIGLWESGYATKNVVQQRRKNTQNMPPNMPKSWVCCFRNLAKHTKHLSQNGGPTGNSDSVPPAQRLGWFGCTYLLSQVKGLSWGVSQFKRNSCVGGATKERLHLYSQPCWTLLGSVLWLRTSRHFNPHHSSRSAT